MAQVRLCFLEKKKITEKELHTRQAIVLSHTTHKMKFSVKDFFSKCDQIWRKLRIWSHLLKKSSMENFIFCAVSTITRPICVFRTTINILEGDFNNNG